MTPRALLVATLARSDLPPGIRAFLEDLAHRARRWPLTPRQIEAVERIAAVPPSPDYDAIGRAARARAEEVCRRLLPAGARVGREWVVGSVAGEKGQSLRVQLTGPHAGAWKDFAIAGDYGSDLIGLAAAVLKISQSEAARGLARMLGIEGVRHG